MKFYAMMGVTKRIAAEFTHAYAANLLWRQLLVLIQKGFDGNR